MISRIQPDQTRSGLLSSAVNPPVYDSINEVEDKIEADKARTDYVEIPLSLVCCYLTGKELVEPTTVRMGTTYSHQAISDWLNGNTFKRMKANKYDPVSRYPLIYKDGTLRNNNWVASLLNNNVNVERIHQIDSEGKTYEVLHIHKKLLNNPMTGKPFFHPTINEMGETIENLELNDWFLNEIYLKIKAAAINQRKINNDPHVQVVAVPPPAYVDPNVPVVVAAPVAVPAALAVDEIGDLDRDAINAAVEEMNAAPAAPAVFGNAVQPNPANLNNLNAEGIPANFLNFNFNQEDIANRVQPEFLRNDLVQYHQQERSAGCRICTSGISCLVCSGGTLVGIVYAIRFLMDYLNHNKCSEPDATINYTFSIPWATGGEICINNGNSYTIALTKFSVTLYAKLTADSPWGDLVQGGKVTSVTNGDGSTTYTVTPGAIDYISANGFACMQYNFLSSLAPNSNFLATMGMNPTQVAITLQTDKNSVSNHVVNLKGLQTCVPNPVPNYTIGTWYPNYAIYAANTFVNDIQINQLNQIYYFSIGFNPATGALLSLDPNADLQNLPALALLRMKYPYLKTLMAFGGYCSDPAFNQLTSNVFALNNFVNEVERAIKLAQMDGAVIDWEECDSRSYIDAEKLNLLLSALRKQLEPQNLLVSAALPAGSQRLQKMSDQLCQIVNNTNFVQVMAYDYAGAWSTLSGYLAPLMPSTLDPESVVKTMSILTDLDCIPRKKLLLGMPTYGRAVTVETLDNTNGYNQIVTGVPAGQFDDTGIFLYRCIVAGQCDKGVSLPTDFTVIPTAQNIDGNTTAFEPLGFSASKKMFVSFDDNDSVEAKSKYAVNEDIGGGFFWDASGDVRTSCPPAKGELKSLGCTAFEVFSTATPVINNSTSQNTTSTKGRRLLAVENAPEKTFIGVLADSLAASVYHLVGKQLCNLLNDCPTYFPTNAVVWNDVGNKTNSSSRMGLFAQRFNKTASLTSASVSPALGMRG
jgi:chitinase